jgi:hypothetical protein
MDSIIILLTIVIAVVASIGAIVVCNSSVLAKHKIVHTSQHNDDSSSDKSNNKNSDNNDNNNDNPETNTNPETSQPPPVIIEEPKTPQQQEVLPSPKVTPIINPANPTSPNPNPNPNPNNDSNSGPGPSLSPTSPTVEIDPPISIPSDGGSGGGSGGHSGKSSKDKVNCDDLDLSTKEEKKCNEETGINQNINLNHSPEIRKFSLRENETGFLIRWSNSTYTSPQVFLKKNLAITNQTNQTKVKINK